MKILVPLDGSPTAEAAIPVATRLARESGAELVLLSVAALHLRDDPVPIDVELAPVQEARAYLEEVKRRLDPAPAAITAVWTGPPGPTIVHAASTYGADMIVMTTHGRSDREREMFGSVAEAVLRQAPMRVLVVRPTREVASRRSVAGQAAV
jgi:nucleotide-binding universal stress UspA family protein